MNYRLPEVLPPGSVRSSPASSASYTSAAAALSVDVESPTASHGLQRVEQFLLTERERVADDRTKLIAQGLPLVPEILECQCRVPDRRRVPSPLCQCR